MGTVLSPRLAVAADAASIAAIYNEGIEDRIATFETEPRTSEQIAATLARKADRIRRSSWSVAPRSSRGRAPAHIASVQPTPAWRALSLRRARRARDGRAAPAGGALRGLCGARLLEALLRILSETPPHRATRTLRLPRRRRLPPSRELDGIWRDCVNRRKVRSHGARASHPSRRPRISSRTRRNVPGLVLGPDGSRRVFEAPVHRARAAGKIGSARWRRRTP